MDLPSKTSFQFPKHLSNLQGVIRIPNRLQRNNAFEQRKDQMELKIIFLIYDKTFTRIVLYMNFFHSSGHSLSHILSLMLNNIILYINNMSLSFFLVFYNERVFLFCFVLFLGWFLLRRDERDFNTKGTSPLMKPPLMKYVKSKRYSTKTKKLHKQWKKNRNQFSL